MKKLAVILILILASGTYLLYQRGRNETALPSSPSPSNSSATEKQEKTYKDGTYSGKVTDAFYGSMQVGITISNGKLTDIQFLQYPNEKGHTMEVSNQSLPLLKQEAIQSQSSHVDVISGATQTSEAFQQSLASALIKAQ